MIPETAERISLNFKRSISVFSVAVLPGVCLEQNDERAHARSTV